MSVHSDMFAENILEDGLNANADADTINTNNDNDVTNNADQFEGHNNDKPDYLCVDSDKNFNIRCVGADFEVTMRFFIFVR